LIDNLDRPVVVAEHQPLIDRIEESKLSREEV